jgi:hypothetical protein
MFRKNEKYYVYDGSFVSLVLFEGLPKEVQKLFSEFQGNVVVFESLEGKKHYYSIFLLYPNGMIEFLQGSKKGFDYVIKVYLTQEAYKIKPKDWIF